MVKGKKQILINLLLFISAASNAAVPAWQIVPKESSLTFTATQNGAPVTGEFKTFTNEINFSPENLNEDNVKVVVEMNSLTDPYNQVVDTLKEKDWFDTAHYPQAIFKSNSFAKINEKTYEVKGTLTIRDKSLPATLTFTLEEYSPTKARIKGTTTIKRTAFGVGQGEWADTNTVKDDVQINFTITAVKK